MVRVKICGNKRLEDALEGVKAGADALGFLIGQVHASPDFISKEAAREIIEKLPPFISTVLVTHLSDAEDIISLADFTKVSTVQLHGESKVDDIFVLREHLPNIKLYKTIHVENRSAISLAREWDNCVDAILLDTICRAEQKVGGTGKPHDWSISSEIVRSLHLPVILAGGLDPDNVQDAIKAVQPFAVDVNSGTKGPDGYKDSVKLHTFVENAKQERNWLQTGARQKSSRGDYDAGATYLSPRGQ
jgi:phosphoribosylanthranilate isomerase